HGIWKNERIARNHLEIAERAGSLYEKFVGFTEDLGRIGKHVIDAKESYEKALGKLSEGPGNLVRQVEMLKKLGAKTNKGINEKLLARSTEEGSCAQCPSSVLCVEPLPCTWAAEAAHRRFSGTTSRTSTAKARITCGCRLACTTRARSAASSITS